MGRKVLIATVAAVVLASGSAFAASHWIITSTKQIKPSVLQQLRTKLAYADRAGTVATLCPSGTDTTGQCEVGMSDARCSGSSAAMGGGFDGGSSPPVNATVGYSEPDSDGRGWTVIMANNASTTATYRAVAVCLGTASGPAGDAVTPRSVETRTAREVAAMRAQIRH